MIDTRHLLLISDELTATKSKGAPQQARLRRAISTSYYALFHFFITNAADLLVGQTQRTSPRYNIIYRSFEHAQMRTVCEEASKDPMSANYRKSLQRTSFSDQIRSCAAAFVELQALRHEADYDPAKRISLTDAKAATTNARQAMEDLNSAPEDERQLFLTMLLRFKTRN